MAGCCPKLEAGWVLDQVIRSYDGPVMSTMTATTTSEKRGVMNDLVRRGIYALPAAGVLTAVPWIFILQQPNPKTDPDGYARSVTSTGQAVGGYLYLAGLICLLFGLLALYGYLARTRASSWAAIGMIASVMAIGLILPTFGTLAVAGPVLGDAYVAGHKDVGSAMVLMNGESNRVMSSIALCFEVSLIGAITYAVAMWKSGTLPKVAGILVGAGLALSITISPFVGWLGALFLVVGGLWLAIRVSRAPNAEVTITSMRP
jgi:hypothetical protein